MFSDRLPTVSASQALLDLADDPSKQVRSGVRSLDAILVGRSPGVDSSVGGFERGKVTEIWGGNGAGKTAVALQAAASAIDEGAAVVWVDLIPSNAKLLVITGVNALVDLDYPRYQTAALQKTEQQKWQAGRRYAILGSLVTALNKLAVLNNLAILVTTGCSMRMRSESGLSSALVPGVGGQEWDAGIWNRLVVFRDFGGRFIGVQKCNGKSLISREEIGEPGRILSCEIDALGILRERQVKISDDAIAPPPKPKSSSASKRAYDEIADSEDEDVDEYGWIETDEHALAMESLVEITEHSERENQSR